MAFEISMQYTDRIEEIMEKSYAEISRKVAEVTIRYAPQIEEMDLQGALGQKVSQQLKEQMEKEIEEIHKEEESKRKTEIDDLKSDLAYE